MIVATSSRQSNNPRRIPSGLLLAILFVMPMMLFGQGYFGTLSGNITDPSGALVPGAKVTLVDQQKGYQFATKSDNSGRYVFTTIPPGLYTVSAELKGFDTAPLAVSAETEYMARFVDCAIVVVESGVTTRAQLRDAAANLELAERAEATIGEPIGATLPI